jgi:valyl-tRNA synthetase
MKHITPQEKLEKELHRLQRDLNSQRLLTYIPGDQSDEEKNRQAERASKLARFHEILAVLNKLQ